MRSSRLAILLSEFWQSCPWGCSAYRSNSTLWRPAAFGDFWRKTPKRTWLCTGISPLLYGLRTWL